MVKVDNKRQPVKASMLPGKVNNSNREASKASAMAKSKLPGGFISMEAGADPNRRSRIEQRPGRRCVRDVLSDGRRAEKAHRDWRLSVSVRREVREQP